MQTIYNGISNLGKAIAGSQKVMLVCDASYPFLSIQPQVDDILRDAVVFNDFASNPLYEQVCKGVELFNANQCDTIVAVGVAECMDLPEDVKPLDLTDALKWVQIYDRLEAVLAKLTDLAEDIEEAVLKNV